MAQEEGEVPITKDELTAVLADLAEDVGERERRLTASLPTEAVAGVGDCFEEVRRDWVEGNRSMRTFPVLNAYHRLGIPVSEELRTLLVALDVKVVTLDDIIDTRDLDHEQKVAASVRAAFSTLLEFETFPTEVVREFIDVQYEYWVALSQIPHVELQAMEAIEATEDADERVEVAREVYAYRARDVDAFVRLPGLVADVDDDLLADLLRDLRSFRARYMLFEDFRHIHRDLTEGHYNPAIVLINAVDDPVEATATVEDVHAGFEYSETARDRYADTLRDLEQRPDDLERLVRVTQRVLAGKS